MLQSVEEQKRLQIELAYNTETTTLHVRGATRFDKRKHVGYKQSHYCTHCDRTRHNKDSCFKIHCTPDWYKELIDKRRKDSNGNRSFNVAATASREVSNHTVQKWCYLVVQGVLLLAEELGIDLLFDSSMLHALPASIPFPSKLKLTHDRGALLPDASRYRRFIGRLLYLGLTRPDISFVVQQLRQFL